MSSSVFFKFKSQKEPSRVTFDGTGISVFELKREIISINRLGDGTDFELAVYNEDSNEGISYSILTEGLRLANAAQNMTTTLPLSPVRHPSLHAGFRLQGQGRAVLLVMSLAKCRLMRSTRPG
jgi:DWNN domain